MDGRVRIATVLGTGARAVSYAWGKDNPIDMPGL